MALNGTPAADNLSARFDGDEVYGLGGRDVLTSYSYVDTLLDGGVGNDQLSTYYDVGLVPDVSELAITFSQVGGLGNDRLNFWLYGSNESGTWLNAHVNLSGGDGVDDISLNFVGSWGVFQSSDISSGDGDDVISVTAYGEDRETLSTAAQNIDAGAGNDQVTIRTTGGLFDVQNKVLGGGGNDTIVADAIAQEWNGSTDGWALNEISGGDGNDLIRAVAHAVTAQEYEITGYNVISGDAGDDMIDANSWGWNQLSGGIGNDVIIGTVEKDNYGTEDVNNVLDGGDGDDVLVARANLVAWPAEEVDDYLVTNRLTGGAGNDTLRATISDDASDGGTALNILLAGAGNDSLTATMQAGTVGANRLYGHAGNDRLQSIGGSGNLLNGGPGRDILTAGAGTDSLAGGSGNDIFRFLNLAASTPAARDVIAVFERPGGQLGDRIDLSAIDASVAAGVQHFVFGTSHAVGRLWAVDSGDLTLIRGNVDGDAAVEFEIAIDDGAVRASAYTAADFIL